MLSATADATRAAASPAEVVGSFILIDEGAHEGRGRGALDEGTFVALIIHEDAPLVGGDRLDDPAAAVVDPERHAVPPAPRLGQLRAAVPVELQDALGVLRPVHDDELGQLLQDRKSTR